MKRVLILVILIASQLSLMAQQDKRTEKLFSYYQKGEYQKAIEYAQKLRSKNIDKAGTYYIEGLSNFKLYQTTDKKNYLTKTIGKIYSGMKIDKDSIYSKLFEDELKEIHDTLYSKADSLMQKGDKDQAEYYLKNLVYLFSDTTDYYRELFMPKPKKEKQQLAVREYNGAINQTDALGRRQGLWVKYYDDGTVMYEIEFKDNHPSGIFRRYYPNGKLMVDMKFEPTGHRAGAIFYDRDGNKLAMGYYYDQKRDSLWQFYINDSIVIKEQYYKKGVKDGPERVYSLTSYPNLALERYWKNGKPDSLYIEYYDNGQPKRMMIYKNGKLNGTYQLFYYNGREKIRGQYKDDFMEGVWTFTNPDGSKQTIKYHKGEPVNAAHMNETETKILKAMEEAKGKYPEPEEMFKKEFGLEQY